MNAATVLGLGMMGSTIARLLVDSGWQVTVWNRSPGKAGALQARGARLAATPEAAVEASDLVVMCVHDYRAAEAILAAPGVSLAIADRVLVQLTTGSPQDARDAQAWAEARGAGYVDGAIQAAPSQMGRPDTPILLSGAAPAFAASKPMLEILAGDLVYLGERIDAAATMDLATLSYVYGATIGFLHGARLAESAELDVAQYGRIVRQISPSFGAFFEHEGKVIRNGDFRVTESPMRISIEATRRILQSSLEAGISTEVPALVVDLFDRAEAAGLGDEEVAALIKVMRDPADASCELCG
jgi:3-hydroxyisobutyrate dehydrogenase-like beta-hydroxyacid dehydrogenase